MRKRVFIMIFTLFGGLNHSMGQLSIDELEHNWVEQYTKGQMALDNKNYIEAENAFLTSVGFLENNGASNTLSYLYSLIKLGEIYHETTEHDKLKEITSKIISIKKKIRPSSKSYILYLYNLGVYYSNIEDFKSAEYILKEALSYDNILIKMDNMKSKILHQLSLCYFFQGYVDIAISTEKQCVESDINLTPTYLNSLAHYYYKAKDWKSLEGILSACYKNARESILRNFSHSKKKERATFWSTEGLFFTDFIPTYVSDNPTDKLTSIAYNSALFSKGILLAAENRTTEITLNSNDPELVNSYSRYLELKRKQNKTIEETIEIETLSEVFIDFQKEHKYDYRDNFRYEWKDIQNELNEKDIAIEFISFSSDKENGIKYGALCIKKGYIAPHFVKIGNISVTEDMYSTTFLYRKIWQVLEQELADVENIYFSPIGILHNIAIEYLPDEDGNNMCMVYNIHRLSSTKELLNHSYNNNNKIVLFGGINYDTTINELADQSKENCKVLSELTFTNVDSLVYRSTNSLGGVSFLAGTLNEINNIEYICKQSNIETSIFSGDKGSEVMFKKMSGTNINILHFATHGFYYANNSLNIPQDIGKLYRNINLTFRNDEIVVLNEDKMLTRSGLLLAGANNLLRKKTIPPEIEDGILYAEEITNVNLSNVNLLVLSACQSGLGDIASSEGVFGLQRGFKLAGVGSIIMSLWEVEDKATEIFMTEFYRNIANKQSKREALTNAQLKLRMVNNGKYDYPEFWAAFILLDGL